MAPQQQTQAPADTVQKDPVHEVPQELVWTRKICGGLRRDIAARCPYFVSDWTDAFTGGNFQQTSASICFLFFACLSPAIAFGTIYQDNTEQQMGVLECVLASAISGMIYALFAGQPLCIIGATGPKLAYMTAFYKICESLEIDFLPARLWIGLWCAFFLVLFALTDASSLMQYATRYMEDIFSAFISMIFIIEAFKSIFSSFERGDTAGFFTMILGFGTYHLAICFKHIKHTHYLNKTLRFTISNFAVTLAIVVITGLARIKQDVDIEWLEVPEKIEPTYVSGTGERRPWLLNPFGNQGLNATGEKRDFPIWAIFAIIVPGLGMALLNYLDQNLTALLINRKDNKLKKPVGYHLDMLVLGGLVYPLCSLLGLPFPCAATVRSVTHLISLTNYEDQPIPGGGTRKVVASVIEQRWTPFAIHVVMFVALFASSIMKYVPKGVLFGVFLYMGVTSMVGNQLFDRFFLWFNFSPNTYPRLPYVTRIKSSRMHLFTAIQVLMLGILYGLTSVNETAVAFPFFIALLIPIRYALGSIFSKEELAVLDSPEDLPPDEMEPEEDEVINEKELDYATYIRGTSNQSNRSGPHGKAVDPMPAVAETEQITV